LASDTFQAPPHTSENSGTSELRALSASQRRCCGCSAHSAAVAPGPRLRCMSCAHASSLADVHSQRGVCVTNTIARTAHASVAQLADAASSTSSCCVCVKGGRVCGRDVCGVCADTSPAPLTCARPKSPTCCDSSASNCCMAQGSVGPHPRCLPAARTRTRKSAGEQGASLGGAPRAAAYGTYRARHTKGDGGHRGCFEWCST
jgi:hypothetical protein